MDKIEIVKNGGAPVPQAFQCKASGRIYPVTPDGSQWEVRVHMQSDLGMGEEIIGEVVFRSYNGGLAPLMAMVVEGQKVAAQLIARAAKQNADAERRIQLATNMPPELKQ